MFHVFRDDARQRLTVTVTGAVTFGEMALLVEQQLAKDAWTYSVLYDARQMVIAATDEDMRDLAAHVGTLTERRRGPVAAVVGPEQRPIVEAYALAALESGLVVAVFGSLADAEDWLAARATKTSTQHG